MGNSYGQRIELVWVVVSTAKKKCEGFKENVLEAKEIKREDPEEGWVHQSRRIGVISDTENTDVRAPDVACLFEQHAAQHPPLISVGGPPLTRETAPVPSQKEGIPEERSHRNTLFSWPRLLVLSYIHNLHPTYMFLNSLADL